MTAALLSFVMVVARPVAIPVSKSVLSARPSASRALSAVRPPAREPSIWLPSWWMLYPMFETRRAFAKPRRARREVRDEA